MLNQGVVGSNNDLACSCHICGDSKTKRKKRLHLFTKDNVHDSVHCFNCGYSSSAYNYFKEFHSEYFSQYKLELNSQKNKIHNHLKKILIFLQKIIRYSPSDES